MKVISFFLSPRTFSQPCNAAVKHEQNTPPVPLLMYGRDTMYMFQKNYNKCCIPWRVIFQFAHLHLKVKNHSNIRNQIQKSKSMHLTKLVRPSNRAEEEQCLLWRIILLCTTSLLFTPSYILLRFLKGIMRKLELHGGKLEQASDCL